MNIRAAFPLITMVISVFANVCAKTTPRDTIYAWYTQIGRWNLLETGIPGDLYLFHNASVDGATSGKASSLVKYNRRFNLPLSASASFSVSDTGGCAGIVLKNRDVSYRFLVTRSKGRATMDVITGSPGSDKRICRFPVSCSDTVFLAVNASVSGLTVLCNDASRKIKLPRDFPASATLCFECRKGSVSVWSVAVKTGDIDFHDNFDSTRVLNLRLNKAFGATENRIRPETQKK